MNARTHTEFRYAIDEDESADVDLGYTKAADLGRYEPPEYFRIDENGDVVRLTREQYIEDRERTADAGLED